MISCLCIISGLGSAVRKLWETVSFFIYYDTYSTVLLIASMHSIVII